MDERLNRNALQPACTAEEPLGPYEPAAPELSEQDEAAVLDEDRHLVCKLCRTRVTREAERISHGGGHSHVFFNPQGLVFEIGCFASAPGAVAVGQPSDEFSWFPGQAWQVGLCRGCQAHLGWRFSGQSLFWGLILDHLASE